MPDWKSPIRARLAPLQLAPARELEITDELEQHLSDRYEELLAQRRDPNDAYRAVIAELEGTDWISELRRSEHPFSEPVAPGLEGGNFFSSIWQDVRYAARTLRNSPGFTIIAVLSLALGIGANSAIFQLLDAVRMRSLPVSHPEELALVKIADRHWNSGNFSGRYPDLTNAMWEQIKAQQQAFSSIAAFSTESFDLSSGGEVRLARGMYVSGDFFNVFQLTPFAGRLFSASDDQRGCGSVPAVISYPFWQREFGGSMEAIGKTFTLEGHPAQVIGVTPPGFFGVEVGRNFDVAVPLCADALLRGEDSRLDVKHYYFLAIIGRLKPGWTLEKATTQLNAISPAVFQNTVPTVYDADSIKHYLAYRLAAFPGGNGVSRLRREYESPLWLLLGIAGLVLLIACANLANLMLARATARERDVAVRLALGASRRRLVRQFLTETVLLAFTGAAVGLLLARIVSALLVRLLSTTTFMPVLNLGIDWRMIAFTTALALITCAIFGVTPALRATKASPAALMNSGGRSNTASRERFALRRVLVVSQVALSLVLVVAAMLFVRSLHHLLTDDGGFQENGVLTVDIDYSRLKLPEDRRDTFKQQLLDSVRQAHGVQFAALSMIPPLTGSGWNNEIEGKGRTNVWMNRVSPSFFAVMGTPLLAGRDFRDTDNLHSQPVAIVNEQFAKKFFPNESVIGKTFRIDSYVGQERPTYEIIGVVKDSKYSDVRDEFLPVAYFSDAQDPKPGQNTEVVVRSDADLVTVLASVKQAIANVNPEISIDTHVLKTQIRDNLVRERLLAALSGFFGLLAAILATVGLYGVVSYMVTRRTNEIGIRMALGATRGRIVNIVVGEAGILLGLGVVIGATLSLIATKAAATLIYGIKPRDPITLIASVLALVIVGVLASVIPALRAARLDPMVALRVE